MSGTIVTASTSVVLVDTSSQSPPYIVYFSYNNSAGRIITVRDNDGYASTGNSIVLSTLSGAYFPDNQNTIFINQPFGFITFSVQSDGLYSILNTFAFPTGSASAYVYTLNTNKINLQDDSLPIFNTLLTSSSALYYNSNIVGDVTSQELSNAILNVQNDINNKFNSQTITRQYLAVGIATTATIQFSDNNGTNWYNIPIGTGFTNGGIDIATDPAAYFVACGDNTGGSPLGFIQWSFDGKTWADTISPPLDSTTLRSRISYANGVWHAVGSGSNGQSILWSTDKTNWHSSLSLIITSTSNIFTGIAYGKTTWVACGLNVNGPESLVWSSNGSNWNANGSLPLINLMFYDIVYDGTNFITLASNDSTSNIYVSPTGSNSWTPVNVNFNNESGYLAANSIIILAVTPTYQKYSINNGYSWISMVGFPSGIPTRPHYDGSVWWVGINGGTYNTYVSPTGYDSWIQSNITGLFPGGYPTGFTSINTSSNLNVQLISTIIGIEQLFKISSLTSDTITLNTFTLDNISDSNILNITSYNTNAVVYIDTLSTTTIETQNLNLTNLNISTVGISSLTVTNEVLTENLTGNYAYIQNMYISTLYSTDVINSSTIVADTISAPYIVVSTLEVFSELNAININSINISSINSYSDVLNSSTIIVSNIIQVDTVSANTVIVSTLQFVDPDGLLAELYTSTNNLYFQGNPIIKNTANPTFFPYKLIDNAGGIPPGLAGQFSIYTNSGSSTNLNSATQLYVYYIDLANTILTGFFNSIGVHCIIHIINDILATDHVYRIDSIILPENNTQYYVFNITSLSGKLEDGVIYQTYNLYVDNIGIPPPISPPSNLVTVFAPINSGSGFDFSAANAVLSMPSYIVQSYGPASGTSFTIQLNNTNYNTSRIPAIIGSIVYYSGGVGSYIVANVKCGSISIGTGAYITIDPNVNAVTVRGLSIANFPATNDSSSNGSGLAIYITLQFLN